MEKTSWFERFREHREKLTHYHPLVTFRSSEHRIKFGTRRDKKRDIPNFSVSEYINKTASELLEFISFYDKHFGSKLTLKKTANS
jgi:phage FluMu gp28-like protein